VDNVQIMKRSRVEVSSCSWFLASWLLLVLVVVMCTQLLLLGSVTGFAVGNNPSSVWSGSHRRMPAMMGREIVSSRKLSRVDRLGRLQAFDWQVGAV
jgi:hypothetical protein